MNTFETKEYKGFDVEIYQDDDMATILFDETIKNDDGHRDYYETYGRWNGYTLFDNEAERYAGYEGWLQFINDKFNVLPYYLDDAGGDGVRDSYETAVKRIESWIDNNLIVLPVYVYEHSGLALSTGSFSCPWDSGQAGYIFATKGQAAKLAGTKVCTSKAREEMAKRMRSYIAYLDDLAQGNVYGYSWDHGGCSGFVGDYDYMMNKAYDEIDNHIISEHQKTLNHKKEQIKKRVPLYAREAYDIA